MASDALHDSNAYDNWLEWEPVELAAPSLAGHRERIAEVLQTKLGEIGFEGIDEPLRSQVIEKWAGALADAVLSILVDLGSAETRERAVGAAVGVFMSADFRIVQPSDYADAVLAALSSPKEGER